MELSSFLTIWVALGTHCPPKKNARDYARLTRRLWRQVTTTRSQARQDENAGERGRATLPTSDAIAAPQDDHIVSLSTTGPRSLGRERDPLLGLRDEVGHGLVEDVLLVGR